MCLVSLLKNGHHLSWTVNLPPIRADPGVDGGVSGYHDMGQASFHLQMSGFLTFLEDLFRFFGSLHAPDFLGEFRIASRFIVCNQGVLVLLP